VVRSRVVLPLVVVAVSPEMTEALDAAPARAVREATAIAPTGVRAAVTGFTVTEAGGGSTQMKPEKSLAPSSDASRRSLEREDARQLVLLEGLRGTRAR
jgi:hypothetical protein